MTEQTSTQTPVNLRFVLSGGPGAGKTTLLTELSARGYRCVPESARNIIATRRQRGLAPRPDPVTFAEQLFRADRDAYEAIETGAEPVFFDRSLVEALGMLYQNGALNAAQVAAQVRAYPYSSPVFLLPPWQAIYRTDSERDQTFAQAQAVWVSLRDWYQRQGYQTVEVPRTSVGTRADFIEAQLALSASRAPG